MTIHPHVKITKIDISEKIITRFEGSSGWLYNNDVSPAENFASAQLRHQINERRMQEKYK